MNPSPDKGANRLGRLLSRIDAHLRKHELFGNAIAPPFNPKPASLLQGLRERIYSLFRPVGHSASAGLGLVLILLLLCFGPSYGLRAGAFALFGASIVLAWLITRYTPPRWTLPAHLALVAVIGGAQWWLAGPDALERGDGLYQHLLVPLSWVMIGVIGAAWLLAGLLFKRFAGRFAALLPETELLTEPTTCDVGPLRFLRAMVVAPFYHPFYFLLPSALVILTVPDRDWMTTLALIALVASWLILSAAAVHERLSMLMELAKQVFFSGGQLVVSGIVILVAALRLAEVHYVSFLIESDPNQVNLTIVSFVVTAYAFLWFYEYWINRLVNERLLDTLRDGTDRPANPATDPGSVEYTVPRPWPADSTERRLLLHGAGRFAVLDGKPNPERAIPRFETYSRSALLDAVLRSIVSCLPQLARQPSAPPTVDVVQVNQDDFSKVKQRLQFYFLALNLLFVAALAVPGYCYIKPLPQKAELSAAGISDGGQFDLRGRLLAQSGADAAQPAILLAASGGGTRAALYTESMLRGLAKAGQLNNLVLASGVSGGGAALAYLAGHRDELAATPFAKDAWETFSQTMAAPFIQDVLEGVGEWRVVGWSNVNGTHEGIRLGELLAESFQTRFFPPLDGQQDHLPRLGEVRELGLILNIALAGHFPGLPSGFQRSPADICNPSMESPAYPRLCEWLADGIDRSSLAVAERGHKGLRTSLSAGGRLIVTNVKQTTPSAFPRQGAEEAPSAYLNYVVLTDPNIDLATAAALNANFPPVFSNAAVDVGGVRRYWVTDGGAVDNRGILSLLYSLRQAIRTDAETPPPLRPTHVVVADASATNLGYHQDRGLGSIFGASQKLASQLMLELMEEIEAIYKQRKSSVTFHTIAMPTVLRSGGGVGTHWMLPAAVTFKQPLEQANLTPGDSADADEVTLTRERVIELVDALHGDRGASPQDTGKEAPEALVWRWIERDWFTAHGAAWQRLMSSLKGGRRTTNCTVIDRAGLCLP